MPIYEYSCPCCGRIEVMQKITETPLELCPVCSKNGRESEVKRLISHTSFMLKGTGWYKTDYASGSSSNGSSKNGNGTKKESISDKVTKESSDSKSSKSEAKTESSSKSSSDSTTSTVS